MSNTSADRSLRKYKKKRRELGIFYTREEAVDFMFDILLLWKKREDKDSQRWDSHKPKQHPSVIDSVYGEGIFLKRALERKFITPDYIMV